MVYKYYILLYIKIKIEGDIKMKKIIIVFVVISLFIVSGLPIFTAIGYEVHTLKQSDTNEIRKNGYDQDYPDLIPRLFFEKDGKHGPFYLYKIYIEVYNIGNNYAYFPAGSVIATLTDYYPILRKTVTSNHSEDYDLFLEPGEIYRVYVGSNHYVYSIGAKFILTVDPNNIVNESEDGEKNNVLEKIIYPRTRHFTFPSISGWSWILYQFPNLFPILWHVLKL